MKYKKIKLQDSKKKKLISFIKIIQSEIKKENKLYDGNLSLIHKYISEKKVNQIRLNSFNKINKLNWREILKEIALENISQILGPDLLIQSKLNLSIQMPQDKSSVLHAHSDSWSSDSPFQINLWIPLTNSYSTNSMFIYSAKKSINHFKNIDKNKNIILSKPNKNNFINARFGDLILFNPAYLHGNQNNDTRNTRVSLNVRLKSVFSPEPGSKNQDRRFGSYYSVFNLSENTKFALKVLDTGILN